MTKFTSKAHVIVRAFVVATLILATHKTVAEGPAFQKTHAEMLAKFDQNGDGRLDDAEREQMRLGTKRERLEKSSSSGVPADVLADYDTNKDGAMDRGEWAKASISEIAILTAKYDANGDGALDEEERVFMMKQVRTVPMRYGRDYCAYLLVYDKNENGGFDGSEYAQAQAAEAKITVTAYDANGDGVLDKAEKSKLQADMRNGTIVGFYLRFASEAAGGGGRNKRGGGGGFLEEQKKLLAFDTNGDGLASADELQRIRETQDKTK